MVWLGTIPAVYSAPVIHERQFKTSDGVTLSYLEAGSGARTIVFIPGWVMPAAIFQKQLSALSDRYRVLAFDPRSQGQSQLTDLAHDTLRRTADMDEFLRAAHVKDFILAGWSLGVLESLDYVARYHPAQLKGLILIDNSIGEGKPPAGRASSFQQTMNDPNKREPYLRKFSQDLFRSPPPPGMLQSVIDSALRVPPKTAIQLMNQPYPRTYWRETVEAQKIPVMYAVTPRLKDQADALKAKRPPELATVLIFNNAGHALFVDQADQFNDAVLIFSQAAFAR
jgi:microsomal epoxide hydrolase